MCYSDNIKVLTEAVVIVGVYFVARDALGDFCVAAPVVAAGGRLGAAGLARFVGGQEEAADVHVLVVPALRAHCLVTIHIAFDTVFFARCGTDIE